MQRYAWTGHSAQAGATSGVIEAAHASAAADALIGRGIIPLTIRESSGPGAGSDAGAVLRSLLPEHLFEPKVAPVGLLIFSRQLNTLLRAGVPILRALVGLQGTATSEKMKTTLAEVRRSLESGIALSMSLAQHPRVFDNFYIALVRVGEMTGRLDEVFLRLFHHAGDRPVPASSAGGANGAIRAIIIASVLYFQEMTGTVVRRAGRGEGTYILAL